MTRFTFLHAADLHLDTPFEGLASRRPAIAEALRDASLLAFERLIDEAIARRVAFVLFAGDLYDGPVRGLRAQLHFRRGLERLGREGIASFVVHGNHDPVDEGWSAIRRWPEGAHVFGPGKVSSVPVLRDGRTLAVVHGVSFGVREERQNLSLGFARLPEPCLQVGLLHCNVDGQPGHDPYAPCSLADLHAANLDYWALGHVHAGRVLCREPSVVAYAGNLQGRSLKPAERGPKGALLVEAEGRQVRSIEALAFAPVRFESLRLGIEDHADLHELEESIAAALPEAKGVAGLVLELRLDGFGELHHDLHARREELPALLEEALSRADRWVHVARVELATAPPAAILRQRDDLLGAVLRRVESYRADPAALRALMAEIDARVPRGVGTEPPDPEALLARAESEAIEKLGGGA